MKQDFEFSVNLNKILEGLLRHAVFIVLTAVLCGAFAFVYNSYFVEKEYSTSVSIIVDNRSSQASGEEEATSKKTSTDITASRMMTQTYIAILKNKSVLNSVADRVNESSEVIQSGQAKPMTATKLGAVLSMKAVNDTEILQITARTTNPQLCADVCFAVVEEAKTVLQRTMNANDVNSIEGEDILVPSSPVSPNVVSKTILFAFLGFVFSSTVFIVISLFDRRVKATDDISKILGYPIIGELPSIKTDSTPKKPFKKKRLFL